MDTIESSPNAAETSRPSPSNTGGAVGGVGGLWASAFVLAALVVLLAGRVLAPSTPGLTQAAGPDLLAALFESRAAAAAQMGSAGGSSGRDVVTTVGHYSMLAFDGGSEDVVVVLDNRAEDLYIYRVLNQNKLEFLGRESVREIFTNARLSGAGTGHK